MGEKFNSFDEAIEYLKTLSYEELIITLFNSLSSSEQMICYEAMALKFISKHVKI